MNIPTQLWIGSEKQLEKAANAFLSQTLCPYKNTGQGCACSSCSNIQKRQHPSVVWLSPHKAQYVLDDIEIAFSKTRFQLEKNEKIFLVFERAHLLGTTCANKLLKLLEEPPKGYHFILLSTNAHALPATVKSRAFIRELAPAAQEMSHALLFFFMNSHFKPAEFEASLKETAPDETESKDLLSELLRIYTKKFIAKSKDACPEEAEDLESILRIQAFLKTALKKPPQPGSSTIFWKNLYLSFPR